MPSLFLLKYVKLATGTDFSIKLVPVVLMKQIHAEQGIKKSPVKKY